MTQEEKQLLLKDLCGRLPYGVKVTDGLHIITLKVRTDTAPVTLAQFMQSESLRYYLRPMSSMTEEEVNEFQAFHCVDGLHPYFYQQMCNLQNLENMFNWLISHHFDYRGLIEMGLAFEAPKEMYKTE